METSYLRKSPDDRKVWDVHLTGVKKGVLFIFPGGGGGVRRQVREAGPSPLSNAEVNNGGAIPSLPIHFQSVVLN
jgi:hypothetical protein